jgi:hypothetical protein
MKPNVYDVAIEKTVSDRDGGRWNVEEDDEVVVISITPEDEEEAEAVLVLPVTM